MLTNEEVGMPITPVRVELMFCESVILQEIAEKETTRDSVALTYAFCIISSEEIDFRKINIAIAERWSRSAVNYIKHKAWRTVKQKTIAIPAQDSKGNNPEQKGALNK